MLRFGLELSFHAHTEATFFRDLKMLGFINQICSEFKLVSSLKIHYYAFVKSMLKYCAVDWNSNTTYGKSQVEQCNLCFLL